MKLSRAALLPWIKEPPLWLLAARLAAALGFLWLGTLPEAVWAGIVLHALGWALASADVVLRLPEEPRSEPLMWLGASVTGFAAGLSGSGLICAVAARAAWEWEARLRERLYRREAACLDILPKTAAVYRSGEALTLPPGELVCGDAVIIQPGAVVPADALIVKGESCVSGPPSRFAVPGGRVYAGEVNETGLLAVKAERVGGDTRAEGLRAAMTQAAGTATAAERRLRRLCAVTALAAAVCALGLAVLPPLLLRDGAFRDWIARAAGLLMAACPLAALSFGPCLRIRAVFDAQSAGGRAAPDSLWALARADMAVLDDTGVHEPDRQAVVGLELGPDEDRDMLLRCAAIAYAYGDGPLAEAVRDYCGGAGTPPDSRETLGSGVTARSAGRTIHAGGAAFLRSRGVECPDDVPSVIRIAADGRLLGGLRIGKRLRPGAEHLAKTLDALHLDIAFLSPEPYEQAELPASRLNVRDIHAGVSAGDRARVFSELLTETHGRALLLGTEPDRDIETGVAVVPDAWNDAAGIARGRVLLAGPSPEPLGAFIARARDFRRLALFMLGAAALMAAASAALTLMFPSWLWLAGAGQAALSMALTALALKADIRTQAVIKKEAESL
ncbi:MAG: hypothetical protein FWG93_01225 [Oscillospiraceae bacterium]|nr:hypothetical protein [Oscillospiraceae bacterium]